MTKADLVEIVYEKVGGLSKKESQDIVETIFDTMKDILKSGEKINMKSSHCICNTIQSRWLVFLLFDLLLHIFEISFYFAAQSNIISLAKRPLWICQLYIGLKIV